MVATSIVYVLLAACVVFVVLLLMRTCVVAEGTVCWDAGHRKVESVSLATPCIGTVLCNQLILASSMVSSAVASSSDLLALQWY